MEEFSIQNLVKMIYELKIELAKTQTLIQKYNGLREKQAEYEGKQDELCTRIKTLEDCLDGKKENKKDWQWILGYILAIASFIYAIFK